MKVFEDKFYPEVEEAKLYFREIYMKEAQVLLKAKSTFKSLLKGLLSSVEIDFIQGRIKSCDESLKKYERKYLKIDEDAGKGYSVTSKISDLLGFRVVCFYEDDIEEVVRILKDELELISTTDKTGKLQESVNEFGYRSYHVDVKINGSRKDSKEYQVLLNIPIEIQVRTISQHTWSVIDHKIKYKKNAPFEVKRRISTLAALFELIDREFVEIRRETNKFEGGETKSLNEKVVPSLVVGEVSESAKFFKFLKFLEEKFPSYNFTPSSVDGFFKQLVELTEQTDYEDVNKLINSIDKNLSKVKDFSMELRSTKNFNLNPYTEIRHALYLENKETFNELLFEYQKLSLTEWLKEKSN